MRQVSIILDGEVLSSECPLGTTLQEFLREKLTVAPELVAVPGGHLVPPALTLVHRCSGQEFSSQIPAISDVPALSNEELLPVHS